MIHIQTENLCIKRHAQGEKKRTQKLPGTTFFFNVNLAVFLLTRHHTRRFSLLSLLLPSKTPPLEKPLLPCGLAKVTTFEQGSPGLEKPWFTEGFKALGLPSSPPSPTTSSRSIRALGAPPSLPPPSTAFARSIRALDGLPPLPPPPMASSRSIFPTRVGRWLTLPPSPRTLHAADKPAIFETSRLAFAMPPTPPRPPPPNPPTLRDISWPALGISISSRAARTPTRAKLQPGADRPQVDPCRAPLSILSEQVGFWRVPLPALSGAIHGGIATTPATDPPLLSGGAGGGARFWLGGRMPSDMRFSSASMPLLGSKKPRGLGRCEWDRKSKPRGFLTTTRRLGWERSPCGSGSNHCSQKRLGLLFGRIKVRGGCFFLVREGSLHRAKKNCGC